MECVLILNVNVKNKLFLHQNNAKLKGLDSELNYKRFLEGPKPLATIF